MAGDAFGIQNRSYIRVVIQNCRAVVSIGTSRAGGTSGAYLTSQTTGASKAGGTSGAYLTSQTTGASEASRASLTGGAGGTGGTSKAGGTSRAYLTSQTTGASKASRAGGACTACQH